MKNKNHCQFYLEGKKFQQDYLDLIKNAKDNICLQTYIFKFDSFGSEVFKCLSEKAEQGITVNLVIDYFGSCFLDMELKEKLIGGKNFNIFFFNPIISPKILQIGRRLHHKVLIVDKEIAIIGGINIIDGIKTETKKAPRLDFAVKIKDDHVNDLYNYCLEISQMVEKGKSSKTRPKVNSDKESPIVFHYNDWINNRKQITSRYMTLINNSKKNIYLIHGYFFPSLKTINALINKAREGVNVNIILPKYSDWQSWVWAAEYLYSKLIKNGIKIYEWQLSELHGKLGIFDEEVILVGSYNLNYTSSYGNLEMNIEIKNRELTNDIIENELQYITDNSIQIDLKVLSKWSWVSHLRNIFFYIVLVLLSGILLNWTKALRRIKKMSFYQTILFIVLILIGLIGVIVTVVAGFRFLLMAME